MCPRGFHKIVMRARSADLHRVEPGARRRPRKVSARNLLFHFEAPDKGKQRKLIETIQ